MNRFMCYVSQMERKWRCCGQWVWYLVQWGWFQHIMRAFNCSEMLQAFLLTYTSGLYHVNWRPQHSPPHFAAGPLLVLTKFTASWWTPVWSIKLVFYGSHCGSACLLEAWMQCPQMHSELVIWWWFIMWGASLDETRVNEHVFWRKKDLSCEAPYRLSQANMFL